MRNIAKLATLVLSTLALAGHVYAANPLTAQIEAPKSPTNQNQLNVNVVVLDMNQVPSISVQCYIQKNSGGFTTLGGPITVIPGGNNTADCQTSASDITDQGTYDFYATANDGTNSVTTQTVSVTYKTDDTPGTPVSYSKSRVNSCEYKISFHTADDGGKTVKVEVYRSGQTSFSADNGSRVDIVNIGSNQDGSSTTTAPTCNQDYFFAVRAFDSNGNGSGLVGDSQTVTVNSTGATGATGTISSGALPAQAGNGNVLGASSGPLGGPTGASGAVLGEGTPSATPAVYTPPQAEGFSKRIIAYAGGALIVILFLVWLANRRKSA